MTYSNERTKRKIQSRHQDELKDATQSAYEKLESIVLNAEEDVYQLSKKLKQLLHLFSVLEKKIKY